MNFRRILLAAAALACVAFGFIAARQIERMRYADRVGSIQEQHDRQLTELRAAGEQWADAVARAQGEVVLRAFAAGEAEYRGAWALQVAELSSRPSTRPGVIDIAVPIANAGRRLAIARMEYDARAVREVTRPADLKSASDSAQRPGVSP